MAEKKITVVISQHQGKNPAKQELEEAIAAELLFDPEIDISLVPHVYDMSADHTGMLFLRGIPGPIVVLTWLYPRAARWILDRQGVRGHEGVTLLKSEDDEDDFDEEEAEAAAPKGIGSLQVPNRRIYVIDLRTHSTADIYLQEIRRIAAEQSVKTVGLMSWIQGNPRQDQLQRYLNPAPVQGNGNGNGHPNGNGHSHGNGHDSHAQATPLLDTSEEAVKRRWYPVIDYSRCTNCMECIDFCLFGVYGVDPADRILVEQQDNCKKGCPACSRVCPENAIIFPGHKSPAIAGADGEVGSLKIDLSKLFGAPDALEVAVMERDNELIADGRDAVGKSVGLEKRQTREQQKPKDDLDSLLDDLDDLDL